MGSDRLYKEIAKKFKVLFMCFLFVGVGLREFRNSDHAHFRGLSTTGKGEKMCSTVCLFFTGSVELGKLFLKKLWIVRVSVI